MKLVSTFKERFAMAIALRNTTQKEVSLATNISDSLINKYIKGVCEPNNIKLGKIADILYVNPVWLMGYDVEMEETPPTPARENAIIINKINQKLASCSIQQLNQIDLIIDTFIKKEN